MDTKISLSAADAAAIAGVLAMSSLAMGGGTEPDNDVFPGDFVGAIDGAVVIQGDLEDRGCGYGGLVVPRDQARGKGYGGGCFPDTTLGLLNISGFPYITDDDESFLGNGLASGIYGEPANPGETIRWAVSGYPDFDFDGFDDDFPTSPHGELGAWEGYIDYYDLDFNYVGTDNFGPFEFVNGDEVFFGTTLPDPDAAMFDIYLDNTLSTDSCYCGDVDYFAVSGLAPGEEYEVRVTAADFDSILQTYDSFGKPISFNDDDPDAGCCLSVLTETADENGDIYFAISEIGDSGFVGDHTSMGFWEIAITEACGSSLSCNDADLASPFDTLDLADINAFVSGFVGMDCVSDFDGNGIYDLADINTFVAAFVGGCP